MSPRLASTRRGGSFVFRTSAALGSGLVVVSVVAGCGGPGSVEVSSPTPSTGVRAMCEDLVEGLPDTVADDLDRRDVTPSDALAAAWGDPAVVLRCGVGKPAALRRTSACSEINGVGWLATQDGREVSGNAPVDGSLTFTTIGRATYVEVTVPPMDDHQPVDPLPALAAPIKSTIPDRHPCQ
jgi:hypothetical protein